MKLSRLIIILLLLSFTGLTAELLQHPSQGDKKLDLSKYHNVGNIWLRVSNFGFFGSGRNNPRWPSLEYPGGSAIDYLFLGGLWFGAKKYRRDNFGRKLYWLPDANNAQDIVAENDSLNGWTSSLLPVVDTLVSVGVEGQIDAVEFLPAYNPLETNLGTQYLIHNSDDAMMTASIREQRRGVDDDGDGRIDEDPPGYAFPFRNAAELPSAFSDYGSEWLHQQNDFNPILENEDIWFPLGFVDLARDFNPMYNYTQPYNDDDDTLTDEDGYPVSEQDYISYYYDYSPFGTSGERDWGSDKGQSTHVPLIIRIRQLSYQWSYDYIKNLIYIEFNIVNMNDLDTLYDCAMGIYMDSDVGPQAWSGNDRSLDDVSSYVQGEGYEFAYTYDHDGDSGLTNGYVGSRVCTPDPEVLDFACWYWNRGDGPDDSDPLAFNPAGPTANEKYWLLTDRNPDDSRFTSLRDYPNSQLNNPDDTRYLFGFFGDMNGMTNPGAASWNLAPGKTMKIVLGLFPGQSLNELKNQSVWSKIIYGKAQDLLTVTQPDLFVHYVAPEPPPIPKMYAELKENGRIFDIYWENSSEIDNLDQTVVSKEQLGWQSLIPGLDSYLGTFTPELQTQMPEEFWPENWNNGEENINAVINPWTAFRLRHDFQGYSLWTRSGSGSQENWMLEEKWDKVDTDQDLSDYRVNETTQFFFDFGGFLGVDKGLPNSYDQNGNIQTATAADTSYYRFDQMYNLLPYTLGDPISGYPVYNAAVSYSQELLESAQNLTLQEQSLLFKHSALRDDIYLEIYDDRLIPLPEHGGHAYVVDDEEIEEHRQNRLARRYYCSQVHNPPRGVEYYLAVTSWDRGLPEYNLGSLESGRDQDANMQIFFPGPSSTSKMDKIYVVPNPYVGQCRFDGHKEYDEKGDKSRRLWFVNLPEYCRIKIYTLAGDLVDVINHEGAEDVEILTVSKAAYTGVAASGIAPWDLLSRNNQIVAPGIYLYSVRDLSSDEIKVGKFVIIK